MVVMYAQTLGNIEFMGCRYPEDTMNQVRPSIIRTHGDELMCTGSMKPQKFVCWMVRRLVGPSVCNNVLKKQGSYTSMVLTEHLLLISNVIFNCY